MHIRHLSYRATLDLELGEPRSLEAATDLEPGEDADQAVRELHQWVEDQLFLLADLAAARRPRGEGVRP